MKRQYFGDRRDYLKYGLLLDLIDGLPGRPSLTSLLMLTPNDQTQEGGLTRYPVGGGRPALWKMLRDAVDQEDRDVRRLREFFKHEGVEYHPWGDESDFDEAGRESYFADMPREWLRDAVVFLDPDVGLDRPSGVKAVERPKYVYEHDLRQLLPDVRQGSTVVLYQHLQHNKNLVERDLRERGARFGRALAIEKVWWLRKGDLAFLVGAADPRLGAALEDVLMRHADTFGWVLGSPADPATQAPVRLERPEPMPVAKPPADGGVRTTEPGYINRRAQQVVRATSLPGNDHGQRVYVLRCGACGLEYGANGSDIFQRRCPACQGGRPGLGTEGAA